MRLSLNLRDGAPGGIHRSRRFFGAAPLAVLLTGLIPGRSPSTWKTGDFYRSAARLPKSWCRSPQFRNQGPGHHRRRRAGRNRGNDHHFAAGNVQVHLQCARAQAGREERDPRRRLTRPARTIEAPSDTVDCPRALYRGERPSPPPSHVLGACRQPGQVQARDPDTHR